MTAQALLVLCDSAINDAQNYLNTFPSNSNSSQFISALQYLSYLQLIRTNVAQAQNMKTLLMQGGDLCMVAAQYYGDASLGFALATANGLLGPNLSSEIEYQISLPPLTG